MELYILAPGIEVNVVVKVNRYGLMDQSMKDIGKITQQMVKVG